MIVAPATPESARSAALWLLPAAAFLALVLVQISLPGIYMDAVNPDYLAAHLLHHVLHNPSSGLPSKTGPLLGNLYHGTQNVYVGLPLFLVAGFNVATLRLAQAVFGVILLAAVYLGTQRLTRSRMLALLCALGVASDVAFTASFRTQFYIVLGGAAWLFVAWMLAQPCHGDPRSERRRTLLSGVFAGLAGYGYFVLLFFVPGFMAIIALRRRDGWRDLPSWLLGVALGLVPFGLGYLSLVWKLHGVMPALAYIRGLLSQLHPFTAGGANGGNLDYAWNMSRLAITDAGNETMVFGAPLPSVWGAAKFYLFAMLLLVTAVLLAVGLARRDPRARLLLPACLPISFVVVASLFGHRLWAHHFSVLVPFTYLLGTLLLAWAADLTGARRVRWHLPVLGLTLVCVAANLVQQQAFHRELARTGGGPKMPEALNTVALEARGAPASVAYVFPDWGFFTSFSFLTANRVRYVADAEPATFDLLHKQGYHAFRVVFWNADDRLRYRQVLLQAGAQHITERTFTRRDGVPAFYLLDGE